MKRILVLGAGKSAPYLIRHLLDSAESGGWRVTVADLDAGAASERVGGHPRGDAIRFDVTDRDAAAREIADSDLVVNLLAPPFQPAIARACVDGGTHMVSASYETEEIRALDESASEKGVVLLTEMGLDPGIDHMSTMELLTRIGEEGGEILDFYSYGGGLPAPDSAVEPLRYVITWNPRNVVMAGAAGAQYVMNGHVKCVPYAQVFNRTWHVEVPGVGGFEAYPNRDSLGYIQAFGLDGVRTMVRGTLRYPGYCDIWRNVVRLGLPNENFVIPDLSSRSYADLVEMFLPASVAGASTQERVARFLDVTPTGRVIEALRWLGLFSEEAIGGDRETAAAVLVDLLGRKLALPRTARDMVILQHELTVRRAEGRLERVTSTMVELGEAGGFTAMSRTVGLPAALAVELLLRGELALTGRQIPTRREIYEPVLRALGEAGINFRERVAAIEDVES